MPYMLNPANAPNMVLAHVAVDCRDAIAANPENEKTAEYLQLMTACRLELSRRARIRSLRREASLGRDPLTRPLRERTWRTVNAETVLAHARDARWSLGWHRRHVEKGGA